MSLCQCLRPRATKFIAVLTFAMVFGSMPVAQAQQPQSAQDPPDAPSATLNTGSASNQKPRGAFETIATRSLFFPDIASTPGPLSTGEKFELFINDSLSLGSVAESGLSSAIAQAMNSPDGYHQGWEGYGKRFGSSMARRASSEFFGTFVLASMLRQDPRFFPQPNPTFKGSVKYSVRRLFVTANDDGRDVPNWSGLLGRLFSESLANVYWPEEDRDAAHTFRRYGEDLGTVIGTNMLRNYWPVFFKKLRHGNK